MAWLLGGVKGASKAQHDAFDALVLAHLDSAHNLARWIVRDAALAEDVVQDAVVRALKYRASFDGRDGRAWFMRIVRNVAYDAAARRKTSGAGVFEDIDTVERLPDPADDPECALSKTEDQATLASALAQLAVELRECIVLRELEGLSYKEIANITGVPVGTVMSRLWRGRRSLSDIAARGQMP